MIDVELVDVLGVGIGHVEFCRRAVGDADFPHCWPVSWGLVYEIAHLDVAACAYMDGKSHPTNQILVVKFERNWKVKKGTWCYGDWNAILVIADASRDPSVEIVVSGPCVVDGEIPVLVRSSPELVVLNPRPHINSC